MKIESLATIKIEKIPELIDHSKKRRKISKIDRGIILVLLLPILIAFWDNISDYVAVMAYNGDHKIIVIANDSGMSLKGKAAFFSTSPELVDYPTLLKNCPNESNNSIEFGCFLRDRNKIYILWINDSRLAPLMAVTASHEMLHKVYSSTSSSDLEKLNSNIVRFERLINSNSNSEDYKKLSSMIKPYSDEGVSREVLINEIHSLVATEMYISDNYLLSHYSKYFMNQKAPVDQYFKQENTINAIENELTQEKNNLDNFKTQYIDKGNATQADIRRQLEYDLYVGNIYNYNINVGIYNSNIPKIQSNIDKYNNLVVAYNTKLNDYNSIFSNLKIEQTIPDAIKL